MGADERVNAGDPFRVRANTWNNIIDSKDSYLRSRGGGVGVDGSDWSDFIPVKNDSGSDIDDLTAVRITDVSIDPSDHIQSARTTPVLKGSPISNWGDYPVVDGATIGIAQQPIKSGAIGMVQFSGMTLAKIRVAHDEDDIVVPKQHNSGGVMASCSYGETGSKIIWKEDGTGLNTDRLAYINLGQFRSRYCSMIQGVLDSSIASSSATGALRDLRGIDGLVRPDDSPTSMDTITIQNHFGWDGETNAKGIAVFRISEDSAPSGEWVLIQLECEDE